MHATALPPRFRRRAVRQGRARRRGDRAAPRLLHRPRTPAPTASSPTTSASPTCPPAAAPPREPLLGLLGLPPRLAGRRAKPPSRPRSIRPGPAPAGGRTDAATIARRLDEQAPPARVGRSTAGLRRTTSACAARRGHLFYAARRRPHPPAERWSTVGYFGANPAVRLRRHRGLACSAGSRRRVVPAGPRWRDTGNVARAQRRQAHEQRAAPATASRQQHDRPHAGPDTSAQRRARAGDAVAPLRRRAAARPRDGCSAGCARRRRPRPADPLPGRARSPAAAPCTSTSRSTPLYFGYDLTTGGYVGGRSTCSSSRRSRSARRPTRCRSARWSTSPPGADRCSPRSSTRRARTRPRSRRRRARLAVRRARRRHADRSAPKPRRPGAARTARRRLRRLRAGPLATPRSWTGCATAAVARRRRAPTARRPLRPTARRRPRRAAFYARYLLTRGRDQLPAPGRCRCVLSDDAGEEQLAAALRAALGSRRRARDSQLRMWRGYAFTRAPSPPGSPPTARCGTT